MTPSIDQGFQYLPRWAIHLTDASKPMEQVYRLLKTLGIDSCSVRNYPRMKLRLDYTIPECKQYP